MLFKAVLAGIVALAAPGQSQYSVVPLPECGDNPMVPACDISPKPKYSPLYSAFIRKESREEALKRYLVIAKAIEKVAQQATQKTVVDDVEEPPIWPWSAGDLAHALVTIAHHESGFRRDVQTGIGRSSLGDCGYWGSKGQKLGAEEARVTHAVYLCRSVCLMQLNTGGLQGSRYGISGKEMVGLDSASLEKCFFAGAKAFSNARARCAKERSSDWFAKAIASYGTGKACEADEAWVSARVKTHQRLGKITAADLGEDIKKLLGLSSS